jgi:hypothetical protein
MRKALLILTLVLLAGCIGQTQTGLLKQPLVIGADEVEVTVRINYGEHVESHAVMMDIGSMVLEATEKVAELGTEEYSFGRLVTSINGVENGVGNHYWQYYVDGELAPVGAGAYVVEEPIEVEWRYEVPPEF